MRSAKALGAILLEQVLTELPLLGVIELHVFQGIDVAEDIALAARLVDDEVVVPHLVEDALPNHGALGADEQGGRHEVPPVPQEHGFQRTQEGLAGAGGRLDDLGGLVVLEVQIAGTAREFIVGGMTRRRTDRRDGGGSRREIGRAHV